MNRRLLTALVAVALLIAGCDSGAGTVQPAEQAVGHNDINPQPADRIEDGGVMQWPVDAVNGNWNPNSVDGSSQTGQWELTNALLPWLFTVKADNSLALDRDYLTSASLISTNPQTVDYKINPKARWSTGRAIDWTDFQAAWQACNGKNPAYQCASTAGLENIGSVTRGADDQDVKVTFDKPFGEWQSLFSPLTPKELNATADEFNKGWADAPKITAAAFTFDKIDATAKTVSVVRDPAWWGTPAHLDRILFKVVGRTALPDAFTSGAIDFYRIGSSLDLYRRAKSTKGLTVRQATEASYNLLDFNGAEGKPLHDQAVRVAVEQAVDNQAIARALLGPMLPDPQPLGNHFFAQGTAQYQDNSGPVKFNPDAAKKALDSLGYKQNGDFRAKDGKEFDLTLVVPAGIALSTAISTLVQSQLKAVGVNVKINAVPPDELFAKYINPGAFDVIGYGTTTPAQPLAAVKSQFYSTPGTTGLNYSAIGSAAVNKLLDDASAELDDGKRTALIQQADAEIWRQGHILPTYQIPGTYAVRDTLANFGAPGFAQFPLDYAAIGFTR
ncbi:ABC transporter family substrate-binding protein [Kutzneria chonburiensis]|uniref:ABC transporter family substrate-binding protein n=1 Tax=Kutzneria chonburiensis TaxID=1483604 RepID=A0ABV6N7R7_9PSEU|nr:ABC transporter family substrate-binding protein [Kutzneria chonburiensis]